MLEIILGLLTVIGGLFAKNRYDKHTIDNQAEEIHAHEKKDEIIEDMGLAKVKARDKRDEALKDNTGSENMDRL